jgi:hypothetical protein
VGLKLNGKHPLLVWADDENLLEDNIHTTKKNAEGLIDASKDVGLQINVEKSKYILLSLHQNSDQNRDRKQDTCSSETSVLTRATRRNNPEDTILHSHRRENLKSYRIQIV